MRSLLILAGVLVVTSIVLAALADSTGADAIAIALGGVGCVLAVAAAFLAVGRSEDRDRAG